jgi:carbonic anhydrase
MSTSDERSPRFQRLLDDNRRWATSSVERDPDYFARRLGGQQPTFLFLGCSDSRVPAEAVTGAEPGELFVHRNIANVAGNDLSFLSVLTFALDVLKVDEIIVCGHQGCGGVAASLSGPTDTLVDHWLAPIVSMVERHADKLAELPDDDARRRKAVEWNVALQVKSLSRNPIVTRARDTRPVPIHGLVYDIADGLLSETCYDGP